MIKSNFIGYNCKISFWGLVVTIQTMFYHDLTETHCSCMMVKLSVRTRAESNGFVMLGLYCN